MYKIDISLSICYNQTCYTTDGYSGINHVEYSEIESTVWASVPGLQDSFLLFGGESGGS